MSEKDEKELDGTLGGEEAGTGTIGDSGQTAVEGAPPPEGAACQEEQDSPEGEEIPDEGEMASDEEEEDGSEEDGSEEGEEASSEKEGTSAEKQGETPTEKQKKGFFKKKKDKKDEQIEDLTDKLKRQMAEFENFRKRTEKEKAQMYDMGVKTMIEKILPIVDNFERGLAGVPEEAKEDAFVVGMDKVYRQLMTELDAVGVKPIEAVGKEFDPEYHNAVMQTESEEYESGTVAQELQKGYLYKDSVVRHSMVAVVP